MPKPIKSMKTDKKTTRRDGLRFMSLAAQSLVVFANESRNTASFTRLPGSAGVSPVVCFALIWFIRRRDAGAPRRQTFGLPASTIFQTFFQVTIEASKAFSLRCEDRVIKIQ